MKNLLISIMIVGPMLADSSITISNVRHAGVPRIGSDVTGAEGEHVIVSVHSGMAIGHQRYGDFSAVAESESAENWTMIRDRDGYRIRNGEGFLDESSEDVLVRISQTGTLWRLRAADGANFEIIGESGRAIEAGWATMAGHWLQMADRTGASNQEWMVSDASVMMVKAPALAHIRGHRVRNASFDMARVEAAPTVTWERDRIGYVYRITVDAPVRQVWFNKLTPYDFSKFDSAPIATPNGWTFFRSFWQSAKPGHGVFALRSSYAPGPVTLSLMSHSLLDAVEADDEDAPQQYHQKMIAAVGRGSHQWVIGPAISPGTDESALRVLIHQWATDGLAFLWPLEDPSRPIADELLEVQAASDFERKALDSIKAFIGGSK